MIFHMLRRLDWGEIIGDFPYSNWRLAETLRVLGWGEIIGDFSYATKSRLGRKTW